MDMIYGCTQKSAKKYVGCECCCPKTYNLTGKIRDKIDMAV